MIEHRPKSELGRSDFGSLKALHHVAVGSDHDNPAHKAVGNLVVWNDDAIAAGTGVPLHPHADMEIITYVREGDVSHKDSLGNQGRLEAGDVQVMSTGTGIKHAEVSDSPTKLFQIWIRPRERGGEPRWGTKSFPKSDRAGRFVVLASGFKEDAEATVDSRRCPRDRGHAECWPIAVLRPWAKAQSLSRASPRPDQAQWASARHARWRRCPGRAPAAHRGD